MSAGDFLARITLALDSAGVPYMVAGSFASTFHGTTRTTQDVDLVIDPVMESLERFVAMLPDDQYYVDLDASREALARRTQFNVIDLATGWKVDLIVRKDREFSRTELERREKARILDADVFIATAEDTVLAKLEWAKAAESERQLRDVAGILEVRGERLDLAYIERWVDALELQDVWKKVRSRR